MGVSLAEVHLLGLFRETSIPSARSYGWDTFGKSSVGRLMSLRTKGGSSGGLLGYIAGNLLLPHELFRGTC
jgi:hypothetical protein